MVPTIAFFTPSTSACMLASNLRDSLNVIRLPAQLPIRRTTSGSRTEKYRISRRAPSVNLENLRAQLLGHFEASLRELDVDADYTREIIARIETTRDAVLGMPTPGPRYQPGPSLGRCVFCFE
jgi:hypothetical protein